MTTGERLVDISTLSTGTAMDHFLNISTGIGETIVNRVYGNYNVKYIPDEISKLSYLPEELLPLSYEKDPVVFVKYVDKKIKVTYVPNIVFKIKAK